MTLFGLLTYGSIRFAPTQWKTGMRLQHRYSRYFWWGSVHLDSDPLGERPELKPCVEESNADCDWDPQYISVHPGLLERALILTALPAFLVAIAFVRGLAHLGVNELLSFMFTMPLFTLAWFYAVGWLPDRWRYKRSLHRASAGQKPS
jgi:hypothetical protein